MTFVQDIWYFAGLTGDVKTGALIRRVIAGEPITLGRKRDGSVFALRDICPHRAAPLSEGRIVEDAVECPYHGWKFGTADGACQEIPALTPDQEMNTTKIKVRHFPTREDGQLIWVYLSSDKRFSDTPPIDPPSFPFANRKPVISDALTLNCHVDHAVIGLMDPAHGPYVHRQWWWRSEHSMHEKAKMFEPRERGFAMAAHSPSSNSFAYKLLGGKPVTEISFTLPGIRTEEIKVGQKTLLSFTAVTPIDDNHTEIRQIFFTDMAVVKLLSPLIKIGARKFLRQDARMVDLQQMGLQFDPNLMLIEDADTQAKWYHAIKREWTKSRAENRPFKNPVKAKTLKWRS
jgi:phenylpropionate dioxygenase-like ring-hydroxylating dioxygenase large terminal subunit